MEKLYIGLVDTPGLFAWMIRKAIRQDYIHVHYCEQIADRNIYLKIA